MPTPTGTLAGELIPVEAINSLTPAHFQHLHAADLSLAQAPNESQLEVDAAFEDMRQLDRDAVKATQEENEQRLAEEAFESTDKAEKNPSEGDAQGDSEKSKSIQNSQTPQLDDDSPISPELTDESIADPLNAASSDESSDKTEQETDNESDEASSEKTEALRELPSDPAAESESKQGGEAAGSTQATNITFAATGQPSDGPRSSSTGATGAVGGGGGGAGDEIAAAAWMQAVADAYVLANGGNGQSSQNKVSAAPRTGDAWFQQVQQPVVVRYDFRGIDGYENQMTPQEQSAAIAAMEAWTAATNGQVQFVRDASAPDSQIVTIGKGSLEALGHSSSEGDTLALGGGLVGLGPESSPVVTGTVWLDAADGWDPLIGNTEDTQGFDVFSVVAHEIGHTLGSLDAPETDSLNIMSGVYAGERTLDSIRHAVETQPFEYVSIEEAEQATSYELHNLLVGAPQLTAEEVQQLLAFSTAVTPSQDAIIALVDRGGNILGVRVEAGVSAAITGNIETLTFAIDGAVAKARTAAFFANNGTSFRAGGGGTPLTSRTIRNISQTTNTYREVFSNPNSTDPNFRGPGFVAPIGLGGHFPAGVANTPPVDLFAIEHTNRDSLIHPGVDGDRRTGADNIALPSRFNVSFSNLLADTDGDNILEIGEGPATTAPMNAPESYGVQSGRFMAGQSRGIATLPGGVPLYRDTNADRVGDTLIGGVGVFFPGPDGTAVFEQNFIPGIGQTEAQRLNSFKVTEAEFIAVATAGGSIQAQRLGAAGADVTANPVPTLDIPFGRIDLVGIQLEVIGRTPGITGVKQVLNYGFGLGAGAVNGTDQPVALSGTVTKGGVTNVEVNPLHIDGRGVPSGWLVRPHDGGDFDGIPGPDITAADVQLIVAQGVQEANRVRAAIRLPLGMRTQMVFSVADKNGDVLGIFRMPDATIFSIDVAVAKARNTAYYADPAAIQTEDRVRVSSSRAASLVTAGTSFTNRTFRFLAEPRYPAGVDGGPVGPFSQLKDIGRVIGVSPIGGANKVRIVESTAPISIAEFNKKGLPLAPNQLFDPNTSVVGHDAFFPATNFRDPGNVANQNGIVFFPGSSALYKNGRLVGGFGVSGDGVDQDDVVTFAGAKGFMTPPTIRKADEVIVDGVRLPNFKFLRNPYG